MIHSKTFVFGACSFPPPPGSSLKYASRWGANWTYMQRARTTHAKQKNFLIGTSTNTIVFVRFRIYRVISYVCRNSMEKKYTKFRHILVDSQIFSCSDVYFAECQSFNKPMQCQNKFVYVFSVINWIAYCSEQTVAHFPFDMITLFSDKATNELYSFW